jgi:hypothetical protein
MLAFEERWAAAVLAGFAPAGGQGIAPTQNEVDYVGTVRRMMRASTRQAAIGLRLALFLTALAPLWLFGRLRTFSSISARRRTEILQRMLSHRLYIVREIAFFLKMCACMAMFAAGAVRERSHYDHDADGLRRLPLLVPAEEAAQ